MKLCIKGLVRFSYPSIGGFRISSGRSPEELQHTLFERDRLESRFELFEKITLPTVLRQSDMGFSLGILVGDLLPDWARDRLDGLVEDHKCLHIVQQPMRPHFRAIRDAYTDLPTDDGATHIASFRLDDDDGLHRDLIARVRTLALGLHAMRDEDRPFVIGFNRGYFLRLDSPDEPLFEVTERTPLGIGLTLVAPVGEATNIYRRNHRSVGAYYDVYTESSRPMFLRTVHGGNDSDAYNSGNSIPVNGKRGLATFHDGFGLNLNDLPGLAGA
jgi:hypothetical protein